MSAFQTILLPTDFSTNARTAFQPALDLATSLSARLIVAHITPAQTERVYYGDLAKELPSFKEQVHDYVMAQFETARSRLPDSLQVDFDHREGEPAPTLIKISEELGVDLIVVASHGFTGSRYNVLGSVAEKLVRSAPCPVLTIRAED
jgi:nucleotide-binding universal stress UspA family protein